MLHFTNPSVNVALKFYVVSLTSIVISIFKSRNPECSSLPNLYHLQMQSNAIQKSRSTFSGTSHGVCIHAYLIHHMNQKEQYFIQMNISNSYCKKRKHHLHLQSAQFNSLIQSYSNVHKKRRSNVRLIFLCDMKLITPLSLF